MVRRPPCEFEKYTLFDREINCYPIGMLSRSRPNLKIVLWYVGNK